MIGERSDSDQGPVEAQILSGKFPTLIPCYLESLGFMAPDGGLQPRYCNFGQLEIGKEKTY